MLEVEELSVGYLGDDVVHGVTLTVAPGEAVAVIGSNGAGKTTLFRGICGLLTASHGRVTFDGEDVSGQPAHKISRRGLAFVPAERHLFPGMTVKENLALGAYPGRPDPATMDFVLSLFPQLADRLSQHAGTMSGGEQQMVAIGRAMMSAPSILMLDEPSLGLSPLLCSELFRALARVKETGVGILLVEQNAKQSLAIADRGYLLDNGHIAAADSAEALSRDEKVKRAYLGAG